MVTARALSSSLVLAVCAALATPASAAPASRLVQWHPRAWTPPVAAECGAPASTLGMLPVPARSVDGEVPSLPDVRADERAAIRIRTRPDGSRYAFVGGAFRTYMIATFDTDGGMQASCIDFRAEALRIVAEATARAAAQATAPREK